MHTDNRDRNKCIVKLVETFCGTLEQEKENMGFEIEDLDFK